MSENTTPETKEELKQSAVDKTIPRKGFRNAKKPNKKNVGEENDMLRGKLVQVGQTIQFLGQQVMQLTTKVTTQNDELQAMASLLRLVPSDAPVKAGDKVLVDCVGRLKNEDGSMGGLFEGSRLDTTLITIGDKKFIPGFEDQLIGLKTGDTTTITVTFPENYTEAIANKTAVFDIVVLAAYVTSTFDSYVRDLNTKYLAEAKLVADAKAAEELAAKPVTEPVEASTEQSTDEVPESTEE